MQPAETASASEAKLDCSKLQDDADVDLALMATAHPGIKSFGKVIFGHLKDTNALLAVCKPWQEAGVFPQEALETYRSAQATAAALLKEVEKLDSIDLDELKPDWGDKATVRMARKAAIGFSQRIMDRLDSLQSVLAAPAAKTKREQAEAAASAASSSVVPELSLQDKYRDRFLGIQAPTPSERDGAIGPRPAKRQRNAPASKAEVEALLNTLRGKAKQDILRQPNKAFYRRLVNLAGVQELPRTPTLCRDAVECMISSAVCALESAPSGKILGKLFHVLQQLEDLKDPADLPGVLLDMADAVRRLP